MARRVVSVALAERSYEVVVAPGLEGLGEAVAHATGARRVALVTDDVVAPLWAVQAEASLAEAGIASTRLTLPAGEEHKHLQTWATLVDGLLASGVDRRTPVVALGGGVVGDLAGFAAASALRGLPMVQVPTTLLAMVDSSVGGKTGFNHARGKNLVGAFHQPRLVWAALETLATLPARERGAGLGEVVKTALIADAALLARLEVLAPALAAGEPDALGEVVARCVAIKAEVVAEDEREGGRRAILNAGHTAGHALEAALGYGTLLHGEAVALGLIAELSWARDEGLLEEADLPERVTRLVGALGLPVVAPAADASALGAALEVDKKSYGNRLTLPITVAAGRTRLVSLARARLPELVASWTA
ncbi:MAG: 3-dehydroquinate synthase [Alphaproteobacteria bacterium]|nr:3-dehydroquinate synthase [Alphaproteobacteria bacterium]